MNSDNSEEIFPVVDAAGNVVGKAMRGECHGGSMLLHPVVHLHVFNSRGELYLQKRPAWKDIQPGRWDTAVGGHVDYGETIAEALRREVREELGITDFVPGRLRSIRSARNANTNWSMSSARSTTARSVRAGSLTAGVSGPRTKSAKTSDRVFSHPTSKAKPD